MKESISETPAEAAEWLDLGSVLGQNQTFAFLAGRCSAAHAEGLRRLRDQKLYKSVSPYWQTFCTDFLKISRSEADRIIQLLNKFGPAYFELSQLTRISPETYRAIAPAIKDGALQLRGEAIPVNPENAREVAAAVAELRRALPRKKPAPPPEMHIQLQQLDKRCTAMLDEFAEIARKEQCGVNWIAFTVILSRMAAGLHRLEVECGVA